MKKTDAKQALCDQHRDLIYLIIRYGHGAMLLAQLRVLCLALNLYGSGQSVNRAVRALRDARILTRKTWIDGNSDLIVACKYVYRYFSGRDSQHTATPPRAKTWGPYLEQSRKIDWLLSLIDNNNLTSLPEVETYLRRRGCTVFLRLPDLQIFYRRYSQYMAAANPNEYRAQLAKLAESEEQRRRVARHLPPLSRPPEIIPVVTMEQMHRRGLYITALAPGEKAIVLTMFALRSTSARRVMDWTIDSVWWVRSLFPGFSVTVILYALDKGHKTALAAALTAPTGQDGVSYWRSRMEAQRLNTPLQIAVHDSDFPSRWCGGVQLST